MSTAHCIAHVLPPRSTAHRIAHVLPPRSTGALKRLAVPFRAALTPAERSEYAQPDVALLLTNLAYYADGLSLDQFRAAVGALLRMGPNAQASHYTEWMKLSSSRISSGQIVCL